MRRLTAVVLCLLAAPASALACGGFFCSSINFEPVQQNSEVILFDVHGDGTITTTVEITYAGSPEDFSWVVPVPSTPVLDVDTPINGLRILDDVTTPTIIPPPTKCSEPQPPMAPGSMNEDALSGAGDDDFDSGGEVVVEDLPQVGPYASQVVSSDDPGALVDWLNTNDYLITPEMEPLVAEYVSQGMKFLAVKLAPNAKVAQITPLGMTYAATAPMVPIQLTAVGAEPEMGVLAFVAADERWESVNYANVEVDAADVRLDPRTGRENYFPLVSWLVDRADGKAMVTQFAGDTTETANNAMNNWSWRGDFDVDLQWLQDLAQRRSHLTRLYTRISPTEMTADPTFQASTGPSVALALDLSDQPAVEVCAPRAASVQEAIDCGGMYCGVGAACASTDFGAGCICPAGTTARRISEPRASTKTVVDTVVCESTGGEMFASLADMGFAADVIDPCGSETCGGHGACVAVNGFPSCSCDDGYAAVSSGGVLSCESVNRRFEVDELPWADGCASGCASSGRASPWLGLLVLLGLVRRRA